MIQEGDLKFKVRKSVCKRLPIEVKEPFFSSFSAGQYRPVIQSQTSWSYWPRLPAICPSEFSYPSRLVFSRVCVCGGVSVGVCVCVCCSQWWLSDWDSLFTISVAVILLCILQFFFPFLYIRWYKKVKQMTFVYMLSQSSVTSSLLLIIHQWAEGGSRGIIYIWVSSAVNISAVQRVICTDTGCHYDNVVQLIVPYRIHPRQSEHEI